MKRFAVFLAFALAILARAPAWAYMPASSRGVYYGGKLHHVTVAAIAASGLGTAP